MRTWTIAGFWCLAAAAATLLDRVAVIADKEVITEWEVLQEIRVVSFLNGDNPDFSPDARRQAAERLVDQYLVRKEMELTRYQEPSPQEAGAMLDKLVQSRFGGTAQFEQELQRRGLTVDDVRAHLLRQLAALRFIDARLGTQTDPQGGSGPASASDPRMEQWLQQLRAQARIEFKKEAFE